MCTKESSSKASTAGRTDGRVARAIRLRVKDSRKGQGQLPHVTSGCEWGNAAAQGSLESVVFKNDSHPYLKVANLP